MPNLLQHEKSPYLLQHRNNPVNWYPWGLDAFEAARREDKPIFLSIGYSTCHWCHVMARESFEDDTVARALNQDYISIKVDREERPDVDGVYMAACIALTGSGGWPLTVLLTGEQKPFWAGTYLPKPQLLSLLDQAARLWRQDRDELLAAGEDLTAHLQKEELLRPGAPSRELVKKAAGQLWSLFDRDWGGFGRAPKFPTPHNLLFLLRYARLSGRLEAADMAEKTLEAMVQGGLFDHIGGGFSRYSTDRRWLVPHFEKMLYDNALLAYVYAEAFQRCRRDLWESVVRRTLDYALRELQGEEGGFFSAQDADSQGVEGKYYVFTPAELETLLGREDAELFCRWYGITEKGNFEGKSIPNRLGRGEEPEPEALPSLRQKLLCYRKERCPLHRDDKVLTSWNGLMIAALAKAGLVLEEPRYIQAARDTAAFLHRNLTDGRGRLMARWREGQAAVPGKLNDYAFPAWGLLELYEATMEAEYLAGAGKLAEILLEHFFDPQRGGFYPYADDDEPLLTRSKEVYDGAIPSGNAVAALVLSRLRRLTGDIRWREAGQKQLEYLAGAAEDQPMSCCFTMLTLLEELWPTAELVCVAREEPEELRAFLRRKSRPELTVLLKTPENEKLLASLAPFTAEYPFPDRGAQYYFCKGGTCRQPVERLAELEGLV